MNVASSPIFLNSAGNTRSAMTDGIRLLYNIQLPIIPSISGTDVIVKSTLGGVEREETYDTLTDTSLMLAADANTPVYITGSITSLTLNILLLDTNDTLLSVKCKNTALTELNCYGCTSLAELNLSANTALERLYCSGCTSLAELNLSANTALTELDCSGCTSLAELNLSANTALTYLYCYGCTSLAELNLSANTALTYLDCSGCTSLSELNLSANTALTYLNCQLLYGIETIKIIAENEDVATAIAGAITGADSTTGTVYVASDATYYQTISDAATAKGWTVEAPAA